MEGERLLRLAGKIFIHECFGRVERMGSGVEFRIDGVGDYAGGKWTIRYGARRFGRWGIRRCGLRFGDGARATCKKQQCRRKQYCEQASQDSSSMSLKRANKNGEKFEYTICHVERARKQRIRCKNTVPTSCNARSPAVDALTFTD